MISAKVMLLGDIGVGKTSLARRFVFGKFDSDYKTTIGVDVLTHDLDLGPACGGETLRLVLWDTDGDFGSRIFETVYVAGASGAIIVGDASRPGTIAKTVSLAERFEERFPGRPIVVIINKIDLVPPPDGLGPAATTAAETLYTSAKTGEGVSELFESLGAAIWRRGI
jgi:Ras-related protein Rab-5C